MKRAVFYIWKEQYKSCILSRHVSTVSYWGPRSVYLCDNTPTKKTCWLQRLIFEWPHRPLQRSLLDQKRPLLDQKRPLSLLCTKNIQETFLSWLSTTNVQKNLSERQIFVELSNTFFSWYIYAEQQQICQTSPVTSKEKSGKKKDDPDIFVRPEIRQMC